MKGPRRPVRANAMSCHVSYAGALAAFTIAIAWSCAEPTADAPTAASSAGTYDLTTVLDSFSFETGGSPPQPDCPNNVTPYCTHSRSFSGATLSGTLTLTPEPPQQTFQPFTTSGTFGGQFCDNVDTQNLTGCVSVKSIPPAAYTNGYLPRPTGEKESQFQGSVGGTLGGPIIRFSGTITTDSLYGRVHWSLFVGRSPPTHYGRFVARRRP